jgi:cellulose biosynthesis protein BcsQ
VLAVSSNKGGVGKTTVTTNLAIYLRALREDLPILLISLDDQQIVERMFGLGDDPPGDQANLKHGWAERSFERMIRLGQYGVHYVPSAPETALLKARAEDPRTLARILEQTAWPGLVILDTKSDLEALTLNALHAADRVLVPVADRASFVEAAKVFRILERDGRSDRARVLLTLVDRRTRIDGAGLELAHRLRDEVRARGWPACETSLSRSPRVEALNSGSDRPLSVLHHARGTHVHREFRELAEEVARDLDLGAFGVPPPRAISRSLSRAARPAVSGLKAALLRGAGRD